MSKEDELGETRVLACFGVLQSCENKPMKPRSDVLRVILFRLSVFWLGCRGLFCWFGLVFSFLFQRSKSCFGTFFSFHFKTRSSLKIDPKADAPEGNLRFTGEVNIAQFCLFCLIRSTMLLGGIARM